MASSGDRSSSSGDSTTTASALLVAGLGAALFALHAEHATADHENARTFALGIGIPMVLSLAVLLGGIALRRGKFAEGHQYRVALWAWLGAGVLAVLVVVLIRYQAAEGVQMSDQLYVVANSASVGAVLGLVVGRYEGRTRAAREEVADERERVERLNARLSVLNRVLRHDIRTKANLIYGEADRVTDGDEDPAAAAAAVRDLATELVDLGEQARRIERTLDRDAGREVIDLGTAVPATLRAFREDHPEVDLAADVDGSYPVRADPAVRSAVRQVLDNAVEHHDRPAPRIEVSADRRPDGTVDLRIADDGPGIPAELRAVLEEGSERPLEHSTGLGLWVVTWIVSASGGDLRFAENDPRGTVVHLRFEAADDTGGEFGGRR